jgi:GNAT superfamily N-acetyltransferase
LKSAAQQIMNAIIIPAEAADAPVIARVLREVATWLEDVGKPLWNPADFTAATILPEAELYRLALVGGDVVGVFKLETSDELFWPDIGQDDSLFLHKLAIARTHTGRGLAATLLRSALEEARERGKRWLRLDCEASNGKLRRIYEDFGFAFHSEWSAPPYSVARYEYDTDCAGTGV